MNHREESLMAAARLERTDLRTSKSRRRSHGSSKRSDASPPETLDDNESAQREQIDTLLLSSLGYWEVERDLIEERMAALGSVVVPS
jgi:hypothetical protein